MFATKKTIGILSVVLLSGCGALKRDNNEDDSSPNDQRDLKLIGSWERGCERADILGLQSRKVKLNFDLGLGFFREQTIFAKDVCADERIVEKQTGTYAKVGDAQGVEGAYQINFTVKNAFVTPRSDQAADDLNKVKYCGLDNWKNDVEQKITNVPCKSGYNEGQVLFDIYKLDENNLQLGQAGFLLDGSNNNARPATLDTLRPYVKK